ncbi:MAG TPA: type II toxin-antitoxin system PemK/MazF family toxin [Verrucomicrobiota bacterium]|nr:type II toxin-antitoxin system PemK/MazF family toxin [Verrucomicrobiota bacterium]
MPATAYSQGEILLAWLTFSGGQGSKRRPVLVVHDFGDDDLLVIPITSHPARTADDAVVFKWKEAGLKLPSTMRMQKLATIEKSCVERKLGRLLPADFTTFKEVLATVCGQFVP